MITLQNFQFRYVSVAKIRQAPILHSSQDQVGVHTPEVSTFDGCLSWGGSILDWPPSWRVVQLRQCPSWRNKVDDDGQLLDVCQFGKVSVA